MVILSLRIRSIEEWRALVPADTVAAPVFVPTTGPLDPGQDVIVEIMSTLLPNHVLIRGTVRDWRPALPRLRVRAGATVAFSPEEQAKLTFVHDVLEGRRTGVARRRHHRLPGVVGVRYRLPASAAWLGATLTEIGVGGALLATTAPLPLGTDVTLELTPPGAAAPLAIACRVSYHAPDPGGTGLRFLTRDADGERRLRELIRRLRAS